MSRNIVLARVIEDLKTRYPQDGDTMTYSEWIATNTKLNGRRFGYEGFEFQPQIINDMHPEMYVIKPSQVGMTEVQVRKFLAFLCRNRGTSGIFTFPDDKMFRKNSKSRIKPVVNQPVFNSTGLDDSRPTRSMELYEINNSFAHILGMTEGDATSTPADILFHDEIDLSDQAMIGLYQSRLQNSSFRITQSFSTPTFPGFGVDLGYNASDMHEYLVKCAACGRWQVALFSINSLHLPGYRGDGNLIDLDPETVAQINLAESYFRCNSNRCAARLDLRDPTLREWVAERPGRMIRGYRIRPTSSYKLDPSYIIRQLLKMKRLDQIKGFHNTVLGETYNDGNSKLEAVDVWAIMGDSKIPEVGKEVPVALASDMGKTCHLTLGVIQGDHVHPFLFETVSSDKIKERIRELRSQYNIVAGAVDRHPYTPTAEDIRDESKNVVLPVEYRGANFVHLQFNEYDQLDFIQINRTQAIDTVVKAVRRKAWTMSGYTNLKAVVTEHMCDMVRIEHPEKMATWEKTQGIDHFMHSLVLLQAAPKIAQIVKMNRKEEPPKVQLGMVGVPLAPSAQAIAMNSGLVANLARNSANFGGLAYGNRPQGPSSPWSPRPKTTRLI